MADVISEARVRLAPIGTGYPHAAAKATEAAAPETAAAATAASRRIARTPTRGYAIRR
jgi:hypothetical protein